MTTTTLRTALLATALALAAAACGSSTSSNDVDAATRRSPGSDHPVASSTTVPAHRPTQPTDRLVEVDHGKLHLRCIGEGPVTVLMLAGWDQGAAGWGPFEGAVAEHARACTYDRFGTGTSDAPAANQTFATQATDLHAALEAAGEPGPYLVVGHSFGGPEAVTFASKFPGELTGVVLIDASPDTWPSVVCTVPAYWDGCDLMRHPERDGERLDVFAAFEQVSKITTVGDLPLTVITAAHRSSDGLTPEEQARLDRRWADGQERWARLSSTAKIVTVDHTGHDIHIDQPQAVLDEVVGLLP
ncbi:alpha/beta fold hydrolase [Aquihabitans sp. McL0605]|uniref:alpha/beta fold hydrolase n=1 Tax=Aquihabitans sp. McL0605 TaxID=3415671 RepID=UPI003CF9CF32